jgi:hypothetical protein
MEGGRWARAVHVHVLGPIELEHVVLMGVKVDGGGCVACAHPQTRLVQALVQLSAPVGKGRRSEQMHARPEPASCKLSYSSAHLRPPVVISRNRSGHQRQSWGHQGGHQ